MTANVAGAQPLLLLDIDGVISLFGFDPRRPPPGRFVLVDGIVHFLSAAVAALLAERSRSFVLVWCSGWEEKADEVLPSALGLPPGLAHLSFRTPAAETAAPRHWKLDAIDAFAGPHRALAWVDDDHDASCTVWAAARPGQTLLVPTWPAVGLTSGHVAELLEWRRGLTAP
ncbi:MAG: HAD domain-containing protein [Solirubrobacteraceae bacterium]